MSVNLMCEFESKVATQIILRYLPNFAAYNTSEIVFDRFAVCAPQYDTSADR